MRHTRNAIKEADMPEINDVVDSYITMWNESDPEARRALVARTLTDDATYTDPLMQGTGPDEITAMIGAAQAQFPGHRFALHTAPDAHHDSVRFSWSLSADGADPAAIGVDFARVAPDGRLAVVTGFLDAAGA
jgi:hypothetical protein